MSPRGAPAHGCKAGGGIAHDLLRARMEVGKGRVKIGDPASEANVIGSAARGAVIHEGTGWVYLLMIAVDNGPDRMVYAGPVFSYYEFEEPGVNRLTDEVWKARLQAGQRPPLPEWTRSYLVPSP